MAKLLDYVSYNDDKQLNRLAKTLGLVLNHDAIWQEAKDQFDDGATSAEVRIDSLDYIIITKDIKKIYKVVSEWAAPTYYDIDTNEELYDECNASVQALWVVSYDPEGHEIIEWLERFYPNEEEEAKARAKELNLERE